MSQAEIVFINEGNVWSSPIRTKEDAPLSLYADYNTPAAPPRLELPDVETPDGPSAYVARSPRVSLGYFQPIALDEVEVSDEENWLVPTPGPRNSNGAGINKRSDPGAHPVDSAALSHSPCPPHRGQSASCTPHGQPTPATSVRSSISKIPKSPQAPAQTPSPSTSSLTYPQAHMHAAVSPAASSMHTPMAGHAASTGHSPMMSTTLSASSAGSVSSQRSTAHSALHQDPRSKLNAARLRGAAKPAFGIGSGASSAASSRPGTAPRGDLGGVGWKSQDHSLEFPSAATNAQATPSRIGTGRPSIGQQTSARHSLRRNPATNAPSTTTTSPQQGTGVHSGLGAAQASPAGGRQAAHEVQVQVDCTDPDYVSLEMKQQDMQQAAELLAAAEQLELLLKQSESQSQVDQGSTAASWEAGVQLPAGAWAASPAPLARVQQQGPGVRGSPSRLPTKPGVYAGASAAASSQGGASHLPPHPTQAASHDHDKGGVSGSGAVMVSSGRSWNGAALTGVRDEKLANQVEAVMFARQLLAELAGAAVDASIAGRERRQREQEEGGDSGSQQQRQGAVDQVNGGAGGGTVDGSRTGSPAGGAQPKCCTIM